MPRDLVRAVIVAAVMAGASLLAYLAHPRSFLADQYPREKLNDILPQQFGDWQVDRSIVPVPPSPELQAVIDKTYDETVAYTYRNKQGDRMMLSLAYGRNQHKGMNTHRPDVCYPAQGFQITQASQRGSLQFNGRNIGVTRLVAQMNSRHEPITYWLLVGDQITYFGYPHRLAAITYGLQGTVPDGVLVRISSIDTNSSRAFELQAQFARDLLQAVPAARLQRLLGVR